MNDGYDNHDCYQPRYCWRCDSELDKQGRCRACDMGARNTNLKVGRMTTMQTDGIIRPRTTIVLHHSASPSHNTTTEDIRRWHIERGFRGIGYHTLVDQQGGIHWGRPLDQAGAHVKGHNQYTVGLCAIGNYEIETPTEALILGLVDAIIEINKRSGYGGGKMPMGMTYHQRLANTACPGKHLIQIFGKLEGLVLGAAVAGNVGTWAREQVTQIIGRFTA